MGKLKVIELFAGVGSQRMALKNLGIEHEVVAIAEINKYAIQSYMAIHGTTLNLGDISNINGEEVPDHDLLTYSFPCQDISIAGNQASLKEGSNTRSSLLWECKKIIESKRPKYLLLENVKNLVGKKHKPHFDRWLEYLKGLGYKNFWKVLNAKDYGVPQNRERVFVISVLDNNFNYEFHKPIQLKKRIKDILEDDVDEKYYISIEQLKTFKLLDFNKDIIGRLNIGNFETNNRVYGINSCGFTLRTKQPDQKILIPQATKKGYIEMSVPGVCDLSYPNSKTRRGRVQENGTICPTLTASSQDIVNIDNKYRIRKLTPLECWRLMGFKDEDFYKAKEIGISNNQLYKQAGNSIVVPVLEEIFKNLFNAEQTNNKETIKLVKEINKKYEQFKWAI